MNAKGIAPLLLLIPVALIMVVITAVLVFGSSKSSQTQPSPTPDDTEQSASPSGKPKTSLKPLPKPTTLTQNDFKDYASKDFSFMYPRSWVLSEQKITGGYSLYIKPENLPAGKLYPKIIVEVTDKTTLTKESRKQNLKNAGFLDSADPMLKDATVLRTSFPYKIESGEIIQQSIQIAYYLFEDDKNVYALAYEYEGDADKAWDTFFSQIFKTFTLKNPSATPTATASATPKSSLLF